MQMAEKTSTAEKSKQPEQSVPVKFAEFLESVPPNQQRDVTDLAVVGVAMRGNIVTGHTLKLSTPEIQMHCSNAQCNGPRFFSNRLP
jgi:hypothetical protein